MVALLRNVFFAAVAFIVAMSDAGVSNATEIGTLHNDSNQTSSVKKCAQVSTKKGLVCQCNSTYCDNVEQLGDVPAGSAVVYTSSQKGDRLERSSLKPSSNYNNSIDNVVDLSDWLNAVTHQTMLGFGGSFSDASAGLVLNTLTDKDSQAHFFNSYFHPHTGLNYSVGRVNIGSCDFSRKSYTLANVADDLALKHFHLRDDINEDKDYKVDFILNAAHVRQQQPLNVFSSVWSVPPWMKTCEPPFAPKKWFANGCDKPNFIFGGLKHDNATRMAYAQYIVKFHEAYRKEGIKLWGHGVQNEPSGNLLGNKWENTYFSPGLELEFANEFLGPALKTAFPDVKITACNDQFTDIKGVAKGVAASKYIDGIGYHWYKSMGGVFEDTKAILGLVGGGIQVRKATNAYNMINKPKASGGNGKFVLSAEACNGFIGTKVIPGSWDRGYRYSRDIIHQLNNNASAWVDWNLVLDTTGGPNHAKNNVDSPVIVQNATHFFKNPMYYALGHFSFAIPPGSERLNIPGVNNDGYLNGKDTLEVVAFKRPDGLIAVVAANDRISPTSEVDTVFSFMKYMSSTRPSLRTAQLKITLSGGVEYSLTLEPNSIKSVLINPAK